jgi:DNA-binding MarR family transcriptional regulator
MSELKRIYRDLVAFKAELRSAVEERLRSEFGLPLSHFEMMAAMDRLAACQVDDIAAELEISSRTATELADRIQAEGYCRLGQACDGGVAVLELTSRGRSLVSQAGAALDEELEHRFAAAVPREVLDQFAAALHRLRRSRLTSSP